MRDSSSINCLSKSTSTVFGGGSNSVYYGSLTAENCLFESCRSESIGGAIRLRITCTLTCTNCIFKDCSASTRGGGICLSDEGLSSVIKLSKVYCSGCSAGYSGSGQAIHLTVTSSFSWSFLCMENCGSQPVYSVTNQPSSSALSSCEFWATNSFTSFAFPYVERYEIWKSLFLVYAI